jgi:hypothetical protein
MEQAIQIIGAVLVLLGYIAAQAGRLDGKARPYLLINLVGSALLALAAAFGQHWGFLILNGTWAVISAVNLVWSLRAGVPSSDGVAVQ